MSTSFLKSLCVASLASLTLPSVAAAAEGIECHPDSKKLEWYVCVLKEVEYKRGMKTETRTECAINKKIEVKGCNLGEIMSYLPAGESGEGFQLYAIGPDDFDDTQWEAQEVQDDDSCKVRSGNLEAYQLTKLSDAPDKSNRERGADFEDKLKAKGKMLVPGGNLAPWRFVDTDCTGKSAKTGKLDAKTQSKFLFYVETTFKK